MMLTSDINQRPVLTLSRVCLVDIIRDLPEASLVCDAACDYFSDLQENEGLEKTALEFEKIVDSHLIDLVGINTAAKGKKLFEHYIERYSQILEKQLQFSEYCQKLSKAIQSITLSNAPLPQQEIDAVIKMLYQIHVKRLRNDFPSFAIAKALNVKPWDIPLP